MSPRSVVITCSLFKVLRSGIGKSFEKMRVKVRYMDKLEEFECSKAMMVEDFRNLVFSKFGVEPAMQRLIYSGKQFADGNDLMDYKIGAGHVIGLMKRVVLADVTASETTTAPVISEETSTASSSSSIPTPGPSREGSENQAQDLEALKAICPELAEEMAKENEENAQPPDPCNVCHDNARRKCKECGCSICGGKDEPETQLFCEQCQYTTHMRCLNPPLTTVPEDDW